MPGFWEVEAPAETFLSTHVSAGASTSRLRRLIHGGDHSHGWVTVTLFPWSNMNLLIGFVVLLCLLCSELRTPEMVDDCWTRLMLVGVIALTVPGLALFQTLIVSRRLRAAELPENQCQAMMRRISVCHSAVWLTASLAIIWSVRWQDIVRGTWELDRWPLVDEAAILAPVMFSLVASWAIFYEVQRTIDGNQGHWLTYKNIKSRIGYVSLRVRIYLLMMLMPIALAVLSRDLSPWLERLSPFQATIACLAVGLALIAGFPFLLLLIWRNQKIDDAALRSEVVETCRQHRVFVHDIRIWKTGNQIVNALAAGILPRFRVMLLSDSLVNLFPRNELLAIVRHEAGHLRLWHLPIRIGFIVLPLYVLAMDERNPFGMMQLCETWLGASGFPGGTGVALIGAVYLGYLYFCLSWLSHRMEYEADIYACQSNVSDPKTFSIDDVRAQDMSDALLRLASVMPSQLDRRTIMHPSIRQRLRLIAEIQQSPSKARQFRDSFVRRRRILVLLLVATGLISMLV